jgi:hypothetical protein
MAEATTEKDACAVDACNVRHSIYSLYSPRQRNAIMFAAALGGLLQYCAAIYRPALKVSSWHLLLCPFLPSVITTLLQL